jgi:glutathione S-transferase
MKDVVVHSIPGSPFGRTVLAVLEEKKVPYRFAMVPPPTLKTPAHLALHPFGRVPVFVHGDFRLYETAAIIRYIDRVAGGASLSPTDPQAAARMDQAMNISDWYLFQGCVSVIGFQRIVGPRVLGLPTDEAAVAMAVPKAVMACDELARLLGEQSHFAGAELSLADFMLASNVDFLAATPEWQLTGARHVNLVRWLERMNQRAALRATTWEKVAAMAEPLRQAS